MKIDAKITKALPTGAVKAIADVTIDDAFAIHGVKVIEGKNDLFASMPSDKWQDKDGNTRHTDIVYPVNAYARNALNEAVKGAYQAFIQNQTGNAQTSGISM